MSDTDKPVSTTTDENREAKNAVFAAQQAAQASQGGVPAMSRQDYTKKEMSIEIPIDRVPLPSLGKVYPDNHPLHNATYVDYRAMTAREEDILMSPALAKKGTMITELIKSCLVNPGIDVSTLLSGDRNALMVAIRSSGYGSDYVANYNCPGCDAKNQLTTNLSALPIKPLELEPYTPGANEFLFMLPVSGKRVVFKFLTGKEEEEILAQVEMRKKKGLLSNTAVTTRLFHSIVEVDGNRDRSFISKFTQVVPAKDSLALRNFMDKAEPAVDMVISFSCAFCDYADEIQMPLSTEFLWPGK